MSIKLEINGQNIIRFEDTEKRGKIRYVATWTLNIKRKTKEFY